MKASAFSLSLAIFPTVESPFVLGLLARADGTYIA